MSLMRPQLQNNSADAVTIPGGSFATLGFTGTVYSGAKFDADGNVYRRTSAGAWQQLGAWLLRGAASSFYLKRVIVSGTLTTDDGAGPQLLSTDREYDVQQSSFGTKTATVSFEISDDISGSPILASRTYIFTAVKEP